ncbi:hypothetical protein MCEMAEM19_00378 [Candidatus Pelagibacterales bacterium]
MQSAGEKYADYISSNVSKNKELLFRDIIKNLPKAPEWLVKKYN